MKIVTQIIILFAIVMQYRCAPRRNPVTTTPEPSSSEKQPPDRVLDNKPRPNTRPDSEGISPFVPAVEGLFVAELRYNNETYYPGIEKNCLCQSNTDGSWRLSFGNSKIKLGMNLAKAPEKAAWIDLKQTDIVEFQFEANPEANPESTQAKEIWTDNSASSCRLYLNDYRELAAPDSEKGNLQISGELECSKLQNSQNNLSLDLEAKFGCGGNDDNQ